MVPQGTEAALRTLKFYYPDLEIVSLDGNYGTDGKSSGLSWVKGSGMSVVAEAIVPEFFLRKKLNTTAENMVELNINKNLIGSAMAGSVGGFNAHAANIVAAIFLATGQVRSKSNFSFIILVTSLI